MTALLRDIGFALRILAKSPGYCLVAILTLAITIGVNATIFSAVNLVLLRPLPYPDPEELVMIVETKPDVERMEVPYYNYLDYRAQNSTLSVLAAMGVNVMSLTGAGDPEKFLVQMLSHDLLPLQGVTPLIGRNFLPEEDAPNAAKVVVLSHGLWTRRFAADPELVGRKISLDGNEWTVVGVLPPDYRALLFPEIGAFIPLGTRADEPAYKDRATHTPIFLFGRMKPGVTVTQVRADMQGLGDELGRRFPDQIGKSRPLVLPLHEEIVRDVRLMMLLLLGAVGCVLLIGTANIANLTLERAMARQRELGIRAALGASRWRLIRQMLVESSVLAVAGGALGLLLALWSVDLMNAYRPYGAAFNTLGEIEIDTTVLVYTTAVALGTGLLFGLVPALLASRQNVAQVLKNADHHASAGGRHLQARNLLVIVEVALALMLAITATLSMRSLAALHRADPGFEPKNLMYSVFSLPPARYPTTAAIVQFWTEVQRRVSAIPGVVAVTVSSSMPNTGLSSHDTFYPLGAAQTPENAYLALTYRADVGFIEMLKIPLLGGRTCGPQDGPGTPPVVLINRGIADKFFPGQDPVGQRLQDTLSKLPSVEIVGVVGSVKNEGVDAQEGTPYQMHYCYKQLALASLQDPIAGMAMLLLARTAGDPLPLAPQVRAAFTELDPVEPLWSISTMEDALEGPLSTRKFTTRLLAVFATMALLLAAVGLYAVMSNTVAQRTRELGVRMALGAQPRAIVALVVRQGMGLVAIGLAIGLLGAFALTRVMTSVVTEAVGATDPATYVGITLLLVIVGLLATYIPARRATRIDPMIALRHE